MRPFGISLNSEKFVREFVGRRAGRWLKQFFDGIGNENLAFLISQNKNLVDYIPSDKKYAYKSFIQPYRDYAKFFTDDGIYSWVPEDLKGIIEAQPNGRQWIYNQLTSIRKFLFS